MDLSNEHGGTLTAIIGVLGFNPALGILTSFSASFVGMISALVTSGPATVPLFFGDYPDPLNHSVGVAPGKITVTCNVTVSTGTTVAARLLCL